MAGDWIKWVKGLPKRREVVVMASILKIDHRIVACACMEVWEWSDLEADNGLVPSVTPVFLDGLVGIPGFSEAMKTVGWLAPTDDGSIFFPRFDRNNGKSAKRRALDQDRKRLDRLEMERLSALEADICPDENVTRGEGEERRGSLSSRKGAKGPDDAQAVASLFASLDWVQVLIDCRKLQTLVPIRKPADKRALVRAAALARTEFSEDWLWSTADAAATKKNPQSYFWATLKKKASELDRDLPTLVKQLDPHIPAELLEPKGK